MPNSFSVIILNSRFLSAQKNPGFLCKQIVFSGTSWFLGFTEGGGQKGVAAEICAVNKTLNQIRKLASKPPLEVPKNIAG